MGMLKSMTAYARTSQRFSFGQITAEIHCVNRKHLEINNFLPKEFTRYDGDIKKWIANDIGRGQVNIKISVSYDTAGPTTILPNLIYTRQLHTALNTIAEDLGVPLDAQTLFSILAQQKDILILEESEQNEELYRQALQEVVSSSLGKLLAMKLFEGHTLYLDILDRFKTVIALVNSIEAKSPEIALLYRSRLKDRIAEALISPEHEDKILREVCSYAERIDIAEEITRLKSHLNQVHQLLEQKTSTDNRSTGKMLEFLLQELNREANTIGSKSINSEISHHVIDIKGELERIREQIQNIE